MKRRSHVAVLPIVVPVVDVFWGWLLSSHIKPWLIELLNRNPLEASQFIDNTIEPRLWISYVVVLAAQLSWVNLIVRRPRSTQSLQRLWWLGCLLITISSVLVHHDLVITAEPELLILVVQLTDLILLYWLTTRLLTPEPLRQVIPGWW